MLSIGPVLGWPQCHRVGEHVSDKCQGSWEFKDTQLACSRERGPHPGARLDHHTVSHTHDAEQVVRGKRGHVFVEAASGGSRTASSWRPWAPKMSLNHHLGSLRLSLRIERASSHSYHAAYIAPTRK